MEPDIAQGRKEEEPGIGHRAEFDAYAAGYDKALDQGLRLSGESKDYFAEGRMRLLNSRLAGLSFRPDAALDFGCGTGSATPYFFGTLGVRRLLGLDPSQSSLEEARRRWGRPGVEFATARDGSEPSFDLAFCNGVFHHIPVAERPAALSVVREALRPGGLFAFWENNPWNPVTRLAMRLVPFDADAVLVWPREARRLLRESGFEILGTDYAFFFPRFLRALRPLEPRLRRFPLGGQYLVLCRKAD